MHLHGHKRRGLTLGELVVVLLIFTALAGLLIPQMASTTDTAKVRTTVVTMSRLRDVLIGTPPTPGYFLDMVIPGSVTGSSLNQDVFLEDLYWYPAASGPSTVYANTFAPNTKLGWRGPYLANSGGPFNVLALDVSFAPYIRPRAWTPPAPPPAALDGWGNPIILQWPVTGNANDPMFVRLVSAGPPSKNTGAGVVSTIVTPVNVQMPLPSQRGNNLLLFLRAADPYASLPGATP